MTVEIFDLITQHVAKAEPDADPDDIALGVLWSLGVRGDTAETLVPLVVWCIATRSRRQNRAIERHAFGPLNAEVIASATRCKTAKTMRTTLGGALDDLIEHGWFKVRQPDGSRRWVAWRDATIENHLVRMAELDTQIAGLRATWVQHEQAVQMLRASGAKSLGEMLAAA